MRKRLFYIGLVVCSISLNGFGQANAFRVNGQLTLSPSYVFSPDEGNFHFHGSTDIFVSNHFSITGAGYFFLGTLSPEPSIFDFNNSLFFGGNYHINTKATGHDFYFGLQPGIAFTKLDADRNEVAVTKMGFNPVFSNVVGYNYSVSPFFYFFAESRIILGNHSMNKAMNIHEIKISAGLGFSLTKKTGMPFLN